MKWNVANKNDFWRKEENHETQTLLGRDLFGWDRLSSHKLLVYLIAMQRLLPAEWKQHSFAELADMIVIWLATRVRDLQAAELLQDTSSNNWMQLRLFAGSAPTGLAVPGQAAPKR